ncbi:F-box protein [Bartonella sp. CDC_skunk]
MVISFLSLVSYLLLMKTSRNWENCCNCQQ